MNPETDITPTPTDAEAAAIVAAITMAWPSPRAAVEDTSSADVRWRFSGRWWNPATPGPRARRNW